MKKTGLALALAVRRRIGRRAAETLHERAMRLHQSAIVVDTHEDVPEELETRWKDLGVRNTTGHIDIPRWREGGVTAPFLAAYVSADYATAGGSAKKAMESIDLIHRIVEKHPKDLVFSDSVAGIRQAKKDGKIAILIGIEGGHAIEDSLGALSSFSPARRALHDADAHQHEQLGGLLRATSSASASIRRRMPCTTA